MNKSIVNGLVLSAILVLSFNGVPAEATGDPLAKLLQKKISQFVLTETNEGKILAERLIGAAITSDEAGMNLLFRALKDPSKAKLAEELSERLTRIERRYEGATKDMLSGDGQPLLRVLAYEELGTTNLKQITFVNRAAKLSEFENARSAFLTPERSQEIASAFRESVSNADQKIRYFERMYQVHANGPEKHLDITLKAYINAVESLTSGVAAAAGNRSLLEIAPLEAQLVRLENLSPQFRHCRDRFERETMAYIEGLSYPDRNFYLPFAQRFITEVQNAESTLARLRKAVTRARSGEPLELPKGGEEIVTLLNDATRKVRYFERMHEARANSKYDLNTPLEAYADAVDSLSPAVTAAMRIRSPEEIAQLEAQLARLESLTPQFHYSRDRYEREVLGRYEAFSYPDRDYYVPIAQKLVTRVQQAETKLAELRETLNRAR